MLRVMPRLMAESGGDCDHPLHADVAGAIDCRLLGDHCPMHPDFALSRLHFGRMRDRVLDALVRPVKLRASSFAPGFDPSALAPGLGPVNVLTYQIKMPT